MNHKIKGKCLMSGKKSTVSIERTEEQSIRFFVNNSTNPIVASLENVVSTQNFVTLGNGETTISLVEHFMAACSFCNIEGLNIYVEGEGNNLEMPILDGSALEWVELLRHNNLSLLRGKRQSRLTWQSINDNISYKNNNASITIEPSEKFQVSYTIDFDHPDLKNKKIHWEYCKNNNEIIEARTFGYLKDLEKFQAMGLALGADKDNTLGLTEEGYTVPLRSELEPIKHKILDLIGDLSLMGINPLTLKAHIKAKNAGHSAHVEFAKLLKERNL